MKSLSTMNLIAACALYTCASTAFAHEGHGLLGAHWHATDVLGFVAAGCALGVALWLSRGDK